MRIKLWHNDGLGMVYLTDEHSAACHGQPVLVTSWGAVYGTGDVPSGCLHAAYDGGRGEYTVGELAWLDDLIVSQALTPVSFSGPSLHWHFGASLKTADQLQRIEAALGERVALA